MTRRAVIIRAAYAAYYLFLAVAVVLACKVGLEKQEQIDIARMPQ
jgi:hypothetical protein